MATDPTRKARVVRDLMATDGLTLEGALAEYDKRFPETTPPAEPRMTTEHALSVIQAAPAIVARMVDRGMTDFDEKWIRRIAEDLLLLGDE